MCHGDVRSSQENSKWDGSFRNCWAVIICQNVRGSFSKPHRCILTEHRFCSYPRFRMHKRYLVHIYGRIEKRRRMSEGDREGWWEIFHQMPGNKSMKSSHIIYKLKHKVQTTNRAGVQFLHPCTDVKTACCHCHKIQLSFYSLSLVELARILLTVNEYTHTHTRIS